MGRPEKTMRQIGKGVKFDKLLYQVTKPKPKMASVRKIAKPQPRRVK